MNISEGLCFDDVLLAPKYSDLSSRSEVDLSVKLNKGFEFKLPFVPSNMRTISELAMVKLMFSHRSLGIFHRFTDIETQLGWLEEVKGWGSDSLFYTGFSVGVKEADYRNVRKFVENGAKILLIDIAHGYSKHCMDMTRFIAKEYPNVLLIAGNVSDGEGMAALNYSGADLIKIGIGAGGICTTRIQSGCGTPSITSLDDCHTVRKQIEKDTGKKIYLMNDGGCKSPGDVAKSLVFADMCMIGGLISATDECPGDILEINEIKYKSYVGSSTHRGAHTEGVEGLKKYKGPAEQVIKELSEGIKSACSYQGVRSLDELKVNARFIKISSAGIRESGAHDLDMVIR